MGPRTKKTDPRVEALLNALRVGNTRRAACARADIAPDTFYRWMAADRTFSDAVEKAEGEAEAHYLTQVFKAATGGTWQAAAWFLERRHPDEFGRRERMDIRFDVPREARKIAEEFGVDAQSAIDEAERIIAEATD